LGGAASLLAANRFFPNTHSGSLPETGNDKDRVGPSKVEEETVMAKADAFKAELEVLRASQEVLPSQVKEALLVVKENTENKTQTQSFRSSSSREEVPLGKASVKNTQHEDETIASLRTEIKTLRAMLLDTRTAESAATRASTVADLPSFSIPPASSSLSSSSSSSSSAPSSLPNWQMASKRSSIAQPSSTPLTSAGSKPSAPKPYERRAAAAKADTTASSSSVPSSTDTETPEQEEEEEQTAHRGGDAQTVVRGADQEVEPVAEEVTPSYAEVVQAAHEKEQGESP